MGVYRGVDAPAGASEDVLESTRERLDVYSKAEVDAKDIEDKEYAEGLVDDLSGVTNASTARTNLDVYSQAEVDAIDTANSSTDQAYADALVDDLSGVSDAATARTNLDVYSKAETVALHGRRNAIINGSQVINQRGFSSVTGVANSSITRPADRFFVYNDDGGGKIDITRSTDVPDGQGFPASTDFEVTTAIASPSGSSELVIVNSIEGYNYKPLEDAGYVTITFWVKTNKTGIYSLALKNGGGAPNYRVYVTEFTVDAADTWQKIEKTIPLNYPAGGTWDYTNGNGIYINIQLMSNSAYYASSNDTWITTNTPVSANQVNLYSDVGNYFRFTGVQVEAGQVATPFEHRSYGEELALCQRYYETGHIKMWASNQNSGAAFGAAIGYAVHKRAAVTPTLTGATYTNASGAGTQDNLVSGFSYYALASGAGVNSSVYAVFNADAEF